MKYPNKEEAKKANHEQICRWWRFLPSATPEQKPVFDIIYKKYKDFGGMTPEISKKIGWDG